MMRYNREVSDMIDKCKLIIFLKKLIKKVKIK